MRRRSRMRTVRRIIAVLLAVGFACAAYIYLTLPDVRVLRTQNPGTTAFIELRATSGDRQGRAAAARAALGELRPHLAEPEARRDRDRRRAFWEHGGVDFQQLKESMEVNLERMEFARGASTITQQLAKNLYLSPSKNPIRKATRAAHRAPARGRALEAAHPRDLPERDRVGQRHLRRRGGGAHLLREVRGGARTAGVGAAGGRHRQPEGVRSRPTRARGCAGGRR